MNSGPQLNSLLLFYSSTLWEARASCQCCPESLTGYFFNALLQNHPIYCWGVRAERHEVFIECVPDPYLDKSLLLESIPLVPFRSPCRATWGVLRVLSWSLPEPTAQECTFRTIQESLLNVMRCSASFILIPTWTRAYCSRCCLSTIQEFTCRATWGVLQVLSWSLPGQEPTAQEYTFCTIQAFLPSDMRCSTSAVLTPTWTRAFCSRVYLFYHSGVPAERHEVFLEYCPVPYLDNSLLLKSTICTIQESLPSDTRCSTSAVLIPTCTRAYCSRVYLLYHSGVPAERHKVFYECFPDSYLASILYWSRLCLSTIQESLPSDMRCSTNAVLIPTWTSPSRSRSGDARSTTSSIWSCPACWSPRWRCSASRCPQTRGRSSRWVSCPLIGSTDSSSRFFLFLRFIRQWFRTFLLGL